MAEPAAEAGARAAAFRAWATWKQFLERGAAGARRSSAYKPPPRKA